MSKRTSYGKKIRPDVHARLPLSRGRILLYTLVKIRSRGRKPASARTWRVRADAS
jgi:hypothetical protein